MEIAVLLVLGRIVLLRALGRVRFLYASGGELEWKQIGPGVHRRVRFINVVSSAEVQRFFFKETLAMVLRSAITSKAVGGAKGHAFPCA